MKLLDNPMVRLNCTVAAAMVHGPREGLRLMAELAGDSRLADHHRLFAVRAHLLEMAGEFDAAWSDYQSAAARTSSTAERNFVLAQAARLRYAAE